MLVAVLLISSIFSLAKHYTHAIESISNESSDSNYNIVCHVRISDLEETHDAIDTSLCTHIVYYFVHLNTRTLTIDSAKFSEFNIRYGQQVAAYKSKGIKVSVQLNELGQRPNNIISKYSRLVQSESARNMFINDAIAFLNEYNLDGLELQWQHLNSWDKVYDPNHSHPSPYLGQFVEEISAVFQSEGLLLSLFMAGPNSYDEQHDLAGLAENFDWIVVTTIGSKHVDRSQTALHHPLYQHPWDNKPNHSMASTLNYWIQNGADSRKLAMYIPTYIFAYRLEDPENNSLNAPVTDKFGVLPDIITANPGCYLLKQGGWTIERDTSSKSLYAFKDDIWITFDDKSTARNKAKYIREHKLFGAVISTLEEDDSYNQCGDGKYPILTTMSDVLGPKKASNGQSSTDIDSTDPRDIVFQRMQKIKVRLNIPIRCENNARDNTIVKPIKSGIQKASS